MLNVAVVFGLFMLVKDTEPGPRTLLQFEFKVAVGSPSSETVPFRVATPLTSTVRSGPAETTGAAFATPVPAWVTVNVCPAMVIVPVRAAPEFVATV
jgi:hypothetical protein